MTIPWGVEHEERPTVPERWRATPLRWKVVVVAVAAIAAGQVVLGLAGGIVGSTPAGSGPSTFDTSPSGTAALAQLLADRGHTVVRSAAPLAQAAPPAGSTLFVIDPSSWTSADTSAVARVLAAGGRVVLTGQPPDAALVGTMFGARGRPVWSMTPAVTPGSLPEVAAVGSSPVTAGVTSVDVAGAATGSIRATGTAPAILVGSGGTFAVAGRPSPGGEPTAIFLASSGPLTNAGLDQSDNAAFALDLAGGASHPVVFDEYDHGYGHQGNGLAGLPVWWQWALGTALLALLVWVLSASRRFGPVEPQERALIPPRIAYAESVATLLASLPAERQAEALGPLVHEGRTLLSRRAGIPAASPDGALAAAAAAAGVPAEVTRPIVDPDHADLVAAGRALAWLERHTGGTT